MKNIDQISAHMLALAELTRYSSAATCRWIRNQNSCESAKPARTQRWNTHGKFREEPAEVVRGRRSRRAAGEGLVQHVSRSLDTKTTFVPEGNMIYFIEKTFQHSEIWKNGHLKGETGGGPYLKISSPHPPIPPPPPPPEATSSRWIYRSKPWMWLKAKRSLVPNSDKRRGLAWWGTRREGHHRLLCTVVLATKSKIQGTRGAIQCLCSHK